MSNEKTIACIFSGHDSAISVYHQGQIYHADLSSIVNRKHVNLIHRIRREGADNVVKTLRKAVEEISEKLKIDLFDPEVVWMEKQITGLQIAVPVLRELFPNIKSYHQFGDERWERHHYLHSLSAYLTSPYDEALSFSFDAGGDNEAHFHVFGFTGQQMDFYDTEDHCPSLIYDRLGFFFAMPYFWKKTDEQRVPQDKRTDLAGKYMGLSAYGKDKVREGREKRIEIMEQWMLEGENSLNNGLQTNVNRSRYYKDRIARHDEFFEHLPEYEWMVELNYLKVKRGFEDIKTRNERTLECEDESPLHLKANKLEWYDYMPKDLMLGLIYELQVAFENTVIHLVEKYYNEIKKRGNNLVFSGGGAYNVCANQRVLEKFPDINFYVSEFPHDTQQSHGLLCYELLKRYSYHHVKSMVQNTRSLPLLDLETVGGEEITIDDMVCHLKNGKIIGFIQDNIELGARALGNRSILCDPSIRDMKDILNAKVKKREWYRPFGPMCRLEDAHIWFESPTFDNMQFMSFTPNVKEEYREVFPSITHVDGTARLQTVTKESNPFIYELLTKFETPLLNTSFNVQGKPILNRLKHALKVLNETDLDYVVVKKEGKLYVY